MVARVLPCGLQLLTCTISPQLTKPALSLLDLSTRDIQAFDKPHLQDKHSTQ
jgi:hypothetical protein